MVADAVCSHISNKGYFSKALNIGGYDNNVHLNSDDSGNNGFTPP